MFSFLRFFPRNFAKNAKCFLKSLNNLRKTQDFPRTMQNISENTIQKSKNHNLKKKPSF